MVRLTSDEFGSGKPVWNVISEPALDSDFKISAGSDEQIIYIAYETEDKDVVAQLLDQSLVLDLEMIVLTYPLGLVVV